MTAVAAPPHAAPRRGAAARHELAVLTASRPALPALLALGRLARPIRRVPRLGWVVGDPVVARQVLNDGATFPLIGEGGVGHLWAQLLGDWVTELFDGPGHHALRARVRDLFTEARATELVHRAAGARLSRASDELAEGRTLDVADLARLLVGRILADLLGLPCTQDSDEAARRVFATGERLAALALRTAASTHLDTATVAAGRVLVEELTANVPQGFAHAEPETMLGQCRELGLDLRQTTGLATLLMVAGTETAASAMARIVALLHDTGEQYRLLAEPERTADAVREALRVTSPAPVIGRSVAVDAELAGRRLKAGERVVLVTHAINNAPGGFDLDRPYIPTTRQLWFGAGRHLCLGAAVARAELTAFLGAVTAAGRPWRVVRRRPARRVLIPSYARLEIALEAQP